ncbi:hypothetical protein FHR99_002927 [Litorivivens lipolytica]|uniref:DUF541 domain-containing protein n=1 Tax=Litorivivens lipolytica TaxID=1524264 RepID=A0A7W4W700_9GAMM|nr:SIMPL domain-containing protein [Litorivivens lipolytica]MBB3048653.1 hypothetical protein [Litorivivens lipolytica]
MRQFVLIVTVLLLALVLFSQFNESPLVPPKPRIVAVEGQGEFEVLPDIVRLHYNVSSLHDSDPAIAKAEVDKIASASVRALMELGVEESDITSSALHVSIQEDYNRNDGSRTRRHRVQRNVEAVLRNPNDYSRALQVLVDSGISEITHIQPEVSNLEELKQKALADAARKARQQADFLAAQFDTEVERVHQIGRQDVQRHFEMREMVAHAAKGGDAPEPPPHDFKPAKVKISSQVFVEFELE